MDDLYADLENYNEVSCVAELRNENKDLKLKLEEYATAMGKLQKEYDKLAMEFHNLQTNYSSLLKTARAEVERKTQMITQLNIDKDMMVLKALQNGNNRFIHNRNKFQKGAPNQKKALTAETSRADTKKCVNEPMQKSGDVKNDRYETSSVSTCVSMPSSENTKLLNIVDKVVEKVETVINKGEFKENISHPKFEHNMTSKTNASSIRNRRKSTPAVSCPKFSSDEETETEKRTNPTTRTGIKEEMPDPRNITMAMRRISNERLSYKTSDTSSMDGKSSIHQEPAREDLRSRINRHDSDKHKLGDRFRDSDRCRPLDRFRDHVRHKESDKYRDGDRYREGDRFRESDRFKHTDKYRESDRYRESDKHREGDKYRDFERNRDMEKYKGRDKYDSSHRHRRNYSPDRPFKRSYRDYQDDYHRSEHGRYRAIESPPPEANYQSRGQEQWPHSERNNHDTDKYKIRCEERFVGQYPTSSDHDEPNSKRQKIEIETHLDVNRRLHEDPVSKLSRTEIYDHEIPRTSCQSPDAAFSPDAYAETMPVHTIKEIKNVAVTPLEDPRVRSKKYIVQTDDGKTILSTIVSKNINIKPVDKSLWNLESVSVPQALLHKPQQQFNDDHIKEIYMDIDNPDVNTSMEPGELVSDCDNTKLAETLPKSDLSKHSTEILTTQKPSPESAPNNSYRIPKLKQRNQNIQSQVSNVTNDLHKIMSEAADDENVKVAKIAKVSSQSKMKSQSSPHSEKHDKLKEANNTNTTIYGNKKDEEIRISLSDMAMVHDDLELSDETSDNADFQKHAPVTREKQKLKQTLETKVDSENITKACFDIISKENITNYGLSDVVADKPDEKQKKQKSKRRKTKSKEIELGESIDIVQETEKKTKSKKEKEKPKQIKNKFTDLFGESSSLITPEDLGIPATCVPLCEDAQDAVDININEMVKASPSNVNASQIRNKKNNDEIQDDTTYSTNPNTEDKEIAKRIEENIAGPAIDSNIVYENLNSEVEINKPDVVQTIIISSGVQPQFVPDSREGTTEQRIAGVEVNIQNIAEGNQLPAFMELRKQNYIQALATSTPHKDFVTPKSLEVESKVVDCGVSCNDSKSDSTDTVAHSMDQSDTNTQDSHDAPDVRIFVRRRRKGVKRT